MKRLTASLCLLPLALRADVVPELFSQHLDVAPAPWSVTATHQPDTRFGSNGEADLFELAGTFHAPLAEGVAWGVLDLDAAARLTVIGSGSGIAALPDALLAARVEPKWTIRFLNGWSFRLGVAPGIWSDALHPAFSCPVTPEFFFAADPELSFVVGAEWRPGWDLAVMPHVGLAWEPDERLRVELGCPRSRIELFPRHVFSLFAGGEWRSVTYALHDDRDWKPDELTLEEILVSAGASVRLFGTTRLTAEVGTWLERKMKADVEERSSLDLSKETFLRFAFQAEF